MKATRTILFAISCLFIAPIALFYLGSVLPLPDDGLLARCFYVPHVFVSYAVYAAGGSGILVSTGGHMALLTNQGIVVVYLLPALLCFVVGILLRSKRPLEDHVA